MICFVIGMLASSFTSVDSAMTSVTTSVLKDICDVKDVSRGKRVVTHLSVATILFLLVLSLGFSAGNTAIDVVYIFVSYLYGPVLGLFAFALFSQRVVESHAGYIPFVALFSVLLSHVTKILLADYYAMGYELLLLNGLFMWTGLLLISQNRPHTN